jgi:hypothetical protein
MSRVGPIGDSTSPNSATHRYAPTSSAMGSGTSAGGRRRSDANWQQVLSTLEGEILAARDSLAKDRSDEIAAWGRRSEDWIPPAGLGPLPDDLRERAMRLLQHQLAVAEALIERITQSQRQRDVAARMSYGPARPVTSYIDRAL